MDEMMMRMMAKLYGLEVMSFIVDYKVGDEDRHGAFQALCMGGSTITAAQGLHHELVSKGWIPQGIMYVPGDHSMEELEAIIDENPPRHEFKPMYLSTEAIREARAMYGK